MIVFPMTVWTKEKEIMGLQHKKYAVYGVQFHPESILTKEGKKILENFMKQESNVKEAKIINLSFNSSDKLINYLDYRKIWKLQK